MKYKYIGTEAQLIEHGFVVVKNQLPISYTKSVNETTGEELVIFMTSNFYKEMVFYYNISHDEILEEHIQDLIDANLIEVTP